MEKELSEPCGISATLGVHHCNRVSVVKYSKEQPPISLTDTEGWSCIQSNNNNAYALQLGSGATNENNKNNTYRLRACNDDVVYPFPMESLIEAYYDCRRNKKSKNECVRYSYDRERYLTELQQEVESGRYKPSESKAFIVTYPTKREVFAANFRDRIIHHWIALRIEPLIESVFILDSYNCRKGKGTHYGIERTKGFIEWISDNYAKQAYIAKWDLKGYFMSIDKDILWSKIKSLVNERYTDKDKDTLLYLLNRVIFNEPQNNCIRTSPVEMWDDLPKNKSLFTNDKNKGLPIGNLTSQLLANFYMADVDSIMKSKHIGYCRYVDDCWLVSDSKKEIKDAVKEFRSMVTELGCTIHPDKYYQQDVSKGIKIIGVVIKPHRIYTSNRTIARAKWKMAEYNKMSVNKESVLKLQQSVNSYLGMMSRTTSFNKRGEILREIAPKWWGYIASVKCRTKIKVLCKQ